jgi:membrane-anchored mycosin MYCP
MTAPRLVRLLLVVTLTGLTQCGMPSAHALSPPPIDDRRLPKPALPSPPQPTVQREVCAAIPPNPGDTKDDERPGLDLPRIWQLTRGAGQRVAIIDTGVSQHPRLPGVVPGGDYVSTGDGTQDCDAHGTLVAGIVSGVAPDVTLISVRQSSAKFAPATARSGAGVGDVETMARAVRTAAGSALDDRALGAALAYAVDVKNAVVVAAAGNTGGAAQCPAQRPDPTWENATVAVSPAWYDDYVLTVGSVNAEGTASAFTLAGPWVDVAATGEGVTSLGSAPLSGTSYAAPVVSGLAALVRARFPALTARQVMRRISSTAHRPPAGRDPFVGNGTVDAAAAVSTDATPQAGILGPSRIPVPIVAPPPPARPNRHGQELALRGAAVLLVALLAAVGVGAARGRLRRRPDGVPGD